VKRVFVDSGGLFAHLAAEDSLHQRAAQLFQQARSEHWQLITTNAVVIETYALLLSRARKGRVAAIRFLDCIEEGLCEVIRVTERDEDQAIALLREQADKTYSLCDALSFVVMKRLRMSTAIAFDRHFREYGQLILL